jgi:hypothetical protein
LYKHLRAAFSYVCCVDRRTNGVLLGMIWAKVLTPKVHLPLAILLEHDVLNGLHGFSRGRDGQLSAGLSVVVKHFPSDQ